jgi:pimeloyl-ACP methyl ester carboxylesterase
VRAGNAQAREAVVFVHGNPGSADDWLDLIEHVSPLGRALAMDMPGYGRADKPADFDYTVAGYARHLGGLLDAEGVEHAHLVLHDLGGAWGLAWAAEHVGRVASLTLLNIGVLPGYRWHSMGRMWRRPLIGELVMALTTRAGMGFALRRGNPRGLPSAYLDNMFAHYDRGTKRAILAFYRNTDDMGAMTEAFGAALAPHRVPTLVLWGMQDPYVPVRYAEMQRRFFAVEEVRLLQDSGHWPMIDNPAATRDAVLPFLKQRLPAAHERPSP